MARTDLAKSRSRIQNENGLIASQFHSNWLHLENTEKAVHTDMTPEQILAIVLLPSATLFITFWAAYQTRLHDRLSVRPYLCIICVGPNAENHPVGIFVENRGLGPAIVKKWTFIRPDGSTAFNKDGIDKILVPAIEQNGMRDHAQLEWAEPGNIIKKDQKLKLFWLKNEYVVAANMHALMTSFNISIKYESMYGEEMKPAYMARHPAG